MVHHEHLSVEAPQVELKVRVVRQQVAYQTFLVKRAVFIAAKRAERHLSFHHDSLRVHLGLGPAMYLVDVDQQVFFVREWLAVGRAPDPFVVEN